MPPAKPIILFCAALDADGVARNTVRLARHLAARGSAVEVVTLRGGILAGELQGVRHTELGDHGLPRAAALAAAVPALSGMLRRRDPALAISMGNHAHLALWSALRPFDDIPRIYRISNDPRHGAAAEGRGGWREAGLGLVARDATRLICVSQQAARAAVFRRARRDRRLHVIPNGIDLGEVRAQARLPCAHPWLTDREPYVVAVGRAHAQKNYGRLVEALAWARRSGRPDLRLLILGRVTPAARRSILQRADALGLDEGSVRLEGEVANPFPLVAGAAVYALPSLWEGASNSLLEALACGTPTVAAWSAGNAAEVLAEGRYGVLARASDVEDLCRAILRQASADHCIRPGCRAEHFALHRTLDAVLGVVRAAVGEHDEIQIPGERPAHLGDLDDVWAGKP